MLFLKFYIEVKHAAESKPRLNTAPLQDEIIPFCLKKI